MYNGQTEHIVIAVAAEENLTNKEKRLGPFFLAFFLKAIPCPFLRLSLSIQGIYFYSTLLPENLEDPPVSPPQNYNYFCAPNTLNGGYCSAAYHIIPSKIVGETPHFSVLHLQIAQTLLGPVSI